MCLKSIDQITVAEIRHHQKISGESRGDSAPQNGCMVDGGEAFVAMVCFGSTILSPLGDLKHPGSEALIASHAEQGSPWAPGCGERSLRRFSE